MKGSCTLSAICEMISPWNGSLMKKMMSSDTPYDSTIPTIEWGSRTLYDSLNSPAKMLPAAIPLVTVLEIPASSSARAKMVPAFVPSSGSRSCLACPRSSTAV